MPHQHGRRRDRRIDNQPLGRDGIANEFGVRDERMATLGGSIAAEVIAQYRTSNDTTRRIELSYVMSDFQRTAKEPGA